MPAFASVEARQAFYEILRLFGTNLIKESVTFAEHHSKLGAKIAFPMDEEVPSENTFFIEVENPWEAAKTAQEIFEQCGSYAELNAVAGFKSGGNIVPLEPTDMDAVIVFLPIHKNLAYVIKHCEKDYRLQQNKIKLTGGWTANFFKRLEK
jgi:hypothetical protein